ncbi:hypothetical protein MLD38_037381 [Melastoma candidum]|uniref:Uncharacterized protein n=1 Tax=Melastoma candidum TaxID=119954 RepID=A0ACB9LPC6_9MYRT|nr:hypothetical protein MLD38_037381 [Melastoma candidum]
MAPCHRPVPGGSGKPSDGSTRGDTPWLDKDGRTVIASIHQPNSEVFELFDQLCLLSRGKNIYFGQASKAYEFFA